MTHSMVRWRSKVAVVTGASAGIGAAIAEKLVQEGLEVVGLARRKELIEEHAKKLTKEKGKLYAIKADMSKEDDILSAFKWIKENLGPIHILVNNAGVLGSTSVIDGDPKIWRKTFDVNVIALCLATKEAIKNMRENNVDGHIVHISSLGGHVVSGLIPNSNVYSASKFAVRALNDTMRLELAASKSKIKMTSISPGPVDTDLVTEFREKNEKLDAIFEESMKSEDVAQAVIFALSTPPNVQIQDILMRPLCF